MFRCGIALMCSQAVAGIHGVELNHISVAGGLGDYRGRRDRGRERVTMYDASLRYSAVGNAAGVNQYELRSATQAMQRALHCQKTGMVDVYLVDLFDCGKAD